MSHNINLFQIGLVNQLVKRGKPIEKEVFNAIVGYNAISEDLDNNSIKSKLGEIYPRNIYNRMVQNTLFIKIKQEN